MTALAAFAPSPTHMPLLSLHLASNRPDRLSGLFDNLQATWSEPASLEVCVKIDSEDQTMRELMIAETKVRPFALRTLIEPRGSGYFGLWRAYNSLWRIASPSAYFVSLINDELRYPSAGWDRRLAAYIGLFPDHVFRLRLSRFRLRNYADLWECGFAPDAFAIYTRPWIALGGDWGAAGTPDAFQQMVAWHLWRQTSHGAAQINRDVPVHDIPLDGELPNLGLDGAIVRRRVRQGRRHWYRLVSPAVQQDCARRARRIEAYIHARREGWSTAYLSDIVPDRQVAVTDAGHAAPLLRLDYGLPALPIHLQNIWRRPLHNYWCGGGRPMVETRIADVNRNLTGWTLRRYELTRHRLGRLAYFADRILRDPGDSAARAWRRLTGTRR